MTMFSGIVFMENKIWIALAVAILASVTPAQAQYQWTSGRPDGSAPIGVMGEQTNSKGEFTLSYRFMQMSMADSRQGTNTVATASVLNSFLVSPTSTDITMHMPGIMFALSDRVTLMGMVNYVDKSMLHVTRSNANFTAESSGLGDASLSALIGLKQSGSIRAHLNAGISIPTGSIEETGVNPTSNGNAVQMPYPMQLGSGTVDLMPGLTILGMSESWSWGVQGRATLRMGETDREYTAGNVTEGTAWFALKVMDRLSVSARVMARNWDDYEGHDTAFTNPMMNPAIREDLRGGTRVDVPLGFNYFFNEGQLKGHRLGAEWSIPVYQDLHGPQLGFDWGLTIGWQKSFEPIG